MNAPHLDIDGEDFGWDIVPAIEKSFGIRFEQNDFEHVRTYGELCGVIQDKLPPATSSTCTSQQAFYKLRLALRTHAVDVVITPDSLLADILPLSRARRHQAAQEIEKSLGMKLTILGAHPIIETPLFIMLLLSFPGLFVGIVAGSITRSWMGVLASLICFATAILGMSIANRFGATIQYTTVRELVSAMSSRFYRQSRRDPSSVNQREIIPHLNELFSHTSGIDLDQLTPDAILT